MIEYHKINSVFKRDPENNFKTFLPEYTTPVFEYLSALTWVGTEKIDGTNIRISTDEIGGRTDKAVIPGSLMPVLVDVQQRMKDMGAEGLTLYGEGYGAGIQKGGGNYRPDKGFVLFDVMGKSGFMPYEPIPDAATASVMDVALLLQLPYAPILAKGSLDFWVAAIREGMYSDSHLHPGAPNEGVVLRPAVELQNWRGDRIITKLKYRDFYHE